RVRDIGNGAVESTKQQYLKDLRVIVIFSKAIEFGLIESCPAVQRIDGGNQCTLRFTPARSIRACVAGSENLFVRQLCAFRIDGDVNSPFIFAVRLGRGSIDHDLPVPQGERTAVEQRTGPEFLPRPLAG